MLATMAPMSSLSAPSPQQLDFHVTPEEVDLFFQSWESEHDVQPALQNRMLDSVISRLLSDSGCATATEYKVEAQTIIQPNAPWAACPQIVTPTVEVQAFQVPSPNNQQRRKRSAALALPDEQTKRMRQQQNVASESNRRKEFKECVLELAELTDQRVDENRYKILQNVVLVLREVPGLPSQRVIHRQAALVGGQAMGSTGAIRMQRQLVDSIQQPIGMFFASASMRMTDANSYLFTRLGFQTAQLSKLDAGKLNINMLDFVHPDFMHRALKVISTLLSGAKATEYFQIKLVDRHKVCIKNAAGGDQWWIGRGEVLQQKAVFMTLIEVAEQSKESGLEADWRARVPQTLHDGKAVAAVESTQQITTNHSHVAVKGNQKGTVTRRASTRSSRSRSKS